MGKVFFSVSMSLDGYIAPDGMDLSHADDPSYNDWLNQWSQLQNWTERQRFFRENLKLGEGGETGEDNRILQETFNRTGVSIMGKRMFDGGERFWPEEAPFHTPVFVLTHQVRSPWRAPAGRPSTSSTTASRARCGRRARSPAAGTCASRAAATPSSSISTRAW